MKVKSVNDKLNVSGDSSEPPMTGTANEEAWYIRKVLVESKFWFQFPISSIDHNGNKNAFQ